MEGLLYVVRAQDLLLVFYNMSIALENELLFGNSSVYMLLIRFRDRNNGRRLIYNQFGGKLGSATLLVHTILLYFHAINSTQLRTATSIFLR